MERKKNIILNLDFQKNDKKIQNIIVIYFYFKTWSVERLYQFTALSPKNWKREKLVADTNFSFAGIVTLSKSFYWMFKPEFDCLSTFCTPW